MNISILLQILWQRRQPCVTSAPRPCARGDSGRYVVPGAAAATSVSIRSIAGAILCCDGAALAQQRATRTPCFGRVGLIAEGVPGYEDSESDDEAYMQIHCEPGATG